MPQVIGVRRDVRLPAVRAAPCACSPVTDQPPIHRPFATAHPVRAQPLRTREQERTISEARAARARSAR